MAFFGAALAVRVGSKVKQPPVAFFETHSLVSQHEPSIPGQAIGGISTAMAASTVNSWNQLSMTDLKL